MPIFGKKSKSKDRNGSEDKNRQKQQQQQQSQPTRRQESGSSNADQTTKNGAPMRMQAGQAPNGAPLSPAERTAQRAALMAASRRRMNTGDSPDYSITGSLTSSTTTPEGKSSHKHLVKRSPDDSKKKKKRGNDSADGPSKDAIIAAATAGQTAVESNESNNTTALADVFSKTPPLQPSDSPTLGFTSGTDSPPGQSQARSQPSVDSGNGSTARSLGTNPYGDANAMQDVRSAQLPRVDSGIVPKTVTAPRTRSDHEAKVLINPPTSKYSSRATGAPGGYISKLDPGPTNLDFTRPVNFSKPSLEFPRPNGSPQSIASQKQPQRQYSTPAEVIDRGRSTAEKPVSSPASPSLAKPRPQYAQPARASSSSSRGSENPLSYTSRTPENSSPSKMANGSTHARAQEPVAYVRKSTTPEAQSFQTADTRRASQSSTKSGARFADGTTLMALQANNTNLESSRKPPTMPVSSSSNPAVANSTSGSKVSTQPPHSTVAPHQASSNYDARKSSNTTSSTHSTTGRRSTLPPIAVLEGYKVNKRGQVLDEEGDAIGELFEGDLIDCVRQRVNAEGEVVDEFGSVVGRVRPVQRRPGVRYSEDSSGLQSPVLQRGMGTAFSSSSSAAGRRDSESSQVALAGASMQEPAPSSRRSTQSKVLSPGLTSQTVISPVDSQGNAIVAELDASTATESYPVFDHSEIFSPSFGSTTQSPSQLIKAELPAAERRESVASVVASRDVSPSAGPKPKKWASRYFDPGPDEPNGPAPSASRRNSQSPATRPSVRTSVSQPASRRNSQAQHNTPISAIPLLKDEQIVASPIAASPIVLPSPRSSSNPPPLSTSSPSFAHTNGRASPSPSTASHQPQSAFKAVLGPTLEDLAEEPPSRSLSAASASKAGRSAPNLHSETQRGAMVSSRGASPVGSRRASLQSGLASRTSMYQPVKRSPLSHFAATPPGSSALADPNNNNAGAATARVPSLRSTVPTTVSPRASSEDADAAPAPDIPKARGRPVKKGLLAGNGEKVLEKRKSRFSMFMPGGGRERGVVS